MNHQNLNANPDGRAYLEAYYRLMSDNQHLWRLPAMKADKELKAAVINALESAFQKGILFHEEQTFGPRIQQMIGPEPLMPPILFTRLTRDASEPVSTPPAPLMRPQPSPQPELNIDAPRLARKKTEARLP